MIICTLMLYFKALGIYILCNISGFNMTLRLGTIYGFPKDVLEVCASYLQPFI